MIAYFLINILVKTHLVVSKLIGNVDTVGPGSPFESHCLMESGVSYRGGLSPSLSPTVKLKNQIVDRNSFLKAWLTCIFLPILPN